MRGFGCLVVVLAVVAVGAFFADQALTRAAEEQTARRVSRALDADAEVDFEGWPVTWHMLNGRIPSATITTIDVPVGDGARLDELNMVLSDVDVNLNDLRKAAGGRRLPPARRGTFDAELGESSVARMMDLPDEVSLTLDNGVATISAGGVNVDGEVEARDGDILVSLSGAAARILGDAEYALDLSDEAGAPAVGRVDIDNGVIFLRGELEEVRR